MTAMIIKSRTLYLLLSAVVVVLLIISGCVNKTKPNIISDKPFASFQKELLDVAFETATAIPVKPFIKDRSKTQETVVDACIKLNQPQLAFDYTKRIDDWRRGLCYANLAFHYAGSGKAQEAQQCLGLADQIAKQDHGQEWRNNSINIVISKTRSKLGQSVQADKLNHSLADCNTDNLASAQAKIAIETSFDEQLKILDGLIQTDDFGLVTYALQTYSQLFNQFYDDANRRKVTEEKIKTSWGKIPVIIRVNLLMDITGFSLDHHDKKKARDLIYQTDKFITEYKWPLDKNISMTARLAALRFCVGDRKKALADVDAALVLFHEQKNQIINIYRTQTILPLAQSYQLMGQRNKALTVYKQAVEESIANPNSRPRSEDLSAICCSMALFAVEPDAQLRTRIYQINKELAQAW